MHSLILFANIWSFPFFIEIYSWLSLSIRKVTFNSCWFVDNNSSWLIFNILWLKVFFVLMWSLRLFNAFALSLSFLKIYCILNLYCSRDFDHRIYRLFNCFVIVKCNKFLWFVKIVRFNSSSTYALHDFKYVIIASNFLSWIS